MATQIQNKARTWWKSSKEDLANDVISTFLFIMARSDDRRALDLHHLRLYSGRAVAGIVPAAGNRLAAAAPTRRHSLQWNVTRSIIDTAVSTVTMNEPRATVETIGGTWTQRRRAHKLDRAIEGIFDKLDLYPKSRLVFRDACVLGTGGLYWFIDPITGEPDCERVHIPHIYIDDADAFYGFPKQLFYVRYIDKDQLAAQYPKSAAAIAVAPPPPSMETGVAAFESLSNLVRVVEAWRLPSSAESDDGLYACVTNGAVLTSHVYKYPTFPFTWMRWDYSVAGFFGEGLSQIVFPMQYRINLELNRMAECLDLMAVPIIFCERGAKVQKQHFQNFVGVVIEYTGKVPQMVVPPSVPRELVESINMEVQQAYALAGVSFLDATSKKPIGLDSGEAIRVYHEIGSRRFAYIEKGYEGFFPKCADTVMDLADSAEGFKVRTKRFKAWQVQDWSKVRVDRENRIVRVFPTSKLPRDTAGRIATIEQLIGARFLDEQEGPRLLAIPDLDSANELRFASMDAIDADIENILDKAIAVSPSPFHDPALAARMAGAHYLREWASGDTPKDRMQLLSNYILENIAVLRQKAEALAAAQQPQQLEQPQQEPQQPAPLLQ